MKKLIIGLIIVMFLVSGCVSKYGNQTCEEKCTEQGYTDSYCKKAPIIPPFEYCGEDIDIGGTSNCHVEEKTFGGTKVCCCKK